MWAPFALNFFEKDFKTFGANAKPPYLCTPNRNKAFGFNTKRVGGNTEKFFERMEAIALKK